MKQFEINGFCDFKYLSNINFAPNGKTACFVVSEASEKSNSYKSFIYQLKGKKVSKLTGGGKERSFFYLNDGEIVFAGDREGAKGPTVETKFYKISLTGGEAELYLTLPVPTEKLIPLKNGDFIAVCTVFPGYEDMYKGDKKLSQKYLDEQKKGEDYEILTQNPWWWNGGGYIKGSYSALYYYETKKHKLRQLSKPGYGIGGASVDKNGRYVWFTETDMRGQRPAYFDGGDLCRIEIATGNQETMVQSVKGRGIGTFLIGDSFVLVLIGSGRHGLNSSSDFYKLNPDTKELTLYYRYDESVGSSVGSDIRYGGGEIMRMVGDDCYFVSTIYDGAEVYKLSDSVLTQITYKGGSVDCFDIHDGRLLSVSMWDMKGQELYDGTAQLTHFNDRAIANRYVAKPQKLNFTTAGHEVHGFVLEPKDYVKGQKYPVIIDIHGGPQTVYGEVFYHEMQVWAGKGYFVIYCNPTGSDGRNAFMDIRGKYGTVDYDDIMAFCDEALKAYPDMDEANFFETGGSYGGFMTNWIIGHTDRFKACASQRSISNWISFWGVSDIGIEFSEDQNDTTLYPDMSVLWEHSPLKYADNAVTPTLFIHSFEDYRCPIDQGYQMYTALLHKGVEARMVCFRGENHELSRSGKPLHRIKRLTEITEWFDNHKS